MAKKEKSVQFCPKCNSPDISNDLSSPAALNFGMLYLKRCNRCGFNGNETLFPIAGIKDLPELKELKQIKKDHPIVNETYGKQVFSNMIKLLPVTGPLSIFLSLFGIFLLQEPYKLIPIIYGLPIGVFFTIFAFNQKKFKENTFLNTLFKIMFIYFLLGPTMGLIFFLFIYRLIN